MVKCPNTRPIRMKLFLSFVWSLATSRAHLLPHSADDALNHSVLQRLFNFFLFCFKSLTEGLPRYPVHIQHIYSNIHDIDLNL